MEANDKLQWALIPAITIGVGAILAREAGQDVQANILVAISVSLGIVAVIFAYWERKKSQLRFVSCLLVTTILFMIFDKIRRLLLKMKWFILDNAQW